MRRTAVVVTLLSLVFALFPAAAGAAKPSGAGSYIVVLKNGDPGKVAAEHSRRHNASVKHVYRHALRGYAARMSSQAAARIARNPRVAYVEPDGVVTTAATTQSDATWGLDRVDQRPNELDKKYVYSETGVGVTAYVIDTGIKRSHTDFSGRVTTKHYDAFGDGQNGEDCHGHGTHVAGTIGGETWGVAKDVTLVPVRVLNCSGSGTWSGVIAGLDWVAEDHVSGPAVANMSLGGGANSSVDAAVKKVHDDGVSVSVAAGNGNAGGKEQDACGYSPARAPDAITVGATTKSDSKTSWSNYGDCVDWFAPGAGITSAWYDSDTSTKTISGTSMAAPHTAGAAALYLETTPGATATQVRNVLFDRTTKGIVTSSKTANNHLLYTAPVASSGGGTSEPAANTAPTASNANASVAVNDSVDITLTGTDPDTGDCELLFTTSGLTGGTLGSPTEVQCVSGAPNTDTAVVRYTAPSASGTHTFNYKVNDGEADSNTATVTITVTSTDSAAPATTVTVSSIDYATSGGKASDRHLSVTLTVVDDKGAAVSGASVSIELYRDSSLYATGSGTTGTAGTLTFTANNAPAGTYTTTVRNVVATGLTWDGLTPANEFIKSS